MSAVVGNSPRCPGLVRRPIRMFESGQKALPDDWEWSRRLPGCPRVAETPSRMFEIGQEALLNVREWSRGPPGYL